MSGANDNDFDIDEPGNVYLIARREPLSIKIGYTAKDPRDRLRRLQTGSPTELVLLGWCPGDLAWEKRLHQNMDRWRMAGEWFRVEKTDEWAEAFRGIITIIRINNHLTGYRQEFEHV